MSSTRFVVPICNSACSSRRLQDMPAGLSSYCSVDDYSASMSRIAAANRSPVGASLLYWVAWLCYILGIFQVFGTPYVAAYYTQFWMGFGLTLFSLVAIVAVGRYIRRKRIEQISAAVNSEHAAYAMRQPQLAWRLVNYGWRQSAIEIEVVNAQEHQIAYLQHQLNQAMVAQQQAMQQQQAYADQQLLPPQQQQPQPVWFSSQQYPTVMPSPYNPAMAVARPVPAQPSIFQHPLPPPPPPHYYAPPAPTMPYATQFADMRQPLVQHQ